jgi:hypothetical protein
MSKDVSALAKEHHAFYEVSSYHILVDENHGSLPARSRTIQAGFDVDIYGVNLKNEFALPGLDPDYAQGYTELQRIAKNVSHQTSDSCWLEVIAFPSRIRVGGIGHAEAQGMLRIRISHHRGLEQPAGAAEEQALKDFEDQLRALGIRRR